MDTFACMVGLDAKAFLAPRPVSVTRGRCGRDFGEAGELTLNAHIREGARAGGVPGKAPDATARITMSMSMDTLIKIKTLPIQGFEVTRYTVRLTRLTAQAMSPPVDMMKPRRRASAAQRARDLRLLSALKTLISLQTDLRRDATSQERHLYSLRRFKEAQLKLDPKYTGQQVTNRQRKEIRQHWEREILQSVNFFEDPATGSLEDALKDPFWLAWEYDKAYPMAFGFLSQAAQNAKLRLSSCSVCYYDPDFVDPKTNGEPGGLQWLVPCGAGENMRSLADKLWEATTVGNAATTPRTICIQDISPSVGAVLMATTPRCVLDTIKLLIMAYLGQPCWVLLTVAVPRRT